MYLSTRKTINSCFTFVCTIVVAFMVGYWFYKYEVEDRDIGVVDSIPLEETEEVKFPAVSLCFQDPFVEKNLREINPNITGHMFRQYLAGGLYDEMYESIDYSNVTLDLGQYLYSGEVGWQNGSTKSITSASIRHFEVFSGFNENDFYKCFGTQYVGEENRKVKAAGLFYDRKRLLDDWSHYSYSYIILLIHYPGQFFLSKPNEAHNFFLPDKESTTIYFQDFEMIKRRNSRKRKCSDRTEDYDDTVIDEFLKGRRCRPSYLNMHTAYPKCKNQKKLNGSKIDFKAQKELGMRKACQRLLKSKVEIKQIYKSRDPGFPGNRKNIGQLWDFAINYPEEVKIITQSKDVDVHSLIGNIEGYLGLFLGIRIYFL